MIEIKNLTFNYPHFTKPVIDDVTLSINPGHVYALLGPNGAGKSTLLYLIAGLLTPQRGSVTLNGVNTRLRQPYTLADIYIVPEEFALPEVTLDQYVDLYSGFYPRFSYDDLRTNLQTFGLDTSLHLGRLSMGQKKKVVMSFALATNTPLLLMDEPTNGLDIPSKANFRSFIASQMTDERAIVISTHQVADINQLLDHIIILDGNHIVLDQSVAEITDKFLFTVTTDPVVATQAILARPSLAGTAVVLPNTDCAESEVNLELLFELATTRPDIIHSVFYNSPIDNL